MVFLRLFPRVCASQRKVNFLKYHFIYIRIIQRLFLCKTRNYQKMAKSRLKCREMFYTQNESSVRYLQYVILYVIWMIWGNVGLEKGYSFIYTVCHLPTHDFKPIYLIIVRSICHFSSASEISHYNKGWFSCYFFFFFQG